MKFLCRTNMQNNCHLPQGKIRTENHILLWGINRYKSSTWLFISPRKSTCTSIYYMLTRPCVSLARTFGTICDWGIARPFSRRAGCIISGRKCGGLSCRKCSVSQKNIFNLCLHTPTIVAFYASDILDIFHCYLNSEKPLFLCLTTIKDKYFEYSN